MKGTDNLQSKKTSRFTFDGPIIIIIGSYLYKVCK